MIKNKKKIITPIIITLVTMAIIASIIIFNVANNTNNKKVISQEQITTTKDLADALKSQAMQLTQENKNDQAKSALQEARSKYLEIDDKDNASNVDSLIYLIDHASQSE